MGRSPNLAANPLESLWRKSLRYRLARRFFSLVSKSSVTTWATDLRSFKRSILAKRNSAASLRLLPCGAKRAIAASASCRVVADIPKEPAPFVFSFCPHQSRFGFGFLHGFVKEANSAKLALNLH